MSDAIAARATGAGGAAIALVRVSGDRAIERVASLSADTLAADAPGQSVTVGTVVLADARWPARFTVFRAPRSYTGEDAVEIAIPGAAPAVAALLDRLYATGVRPADPGEFTRRACLAGRIDLARAEGIQALVRARDDAARRAAIELTDGAVSDRIAETRAALVDVLADLEASLDFLEHEVESSVVEDVAGRIDVLRRALVDLVRGADERRRLDGTPRIVLHGRVNAGKSTLFNALLGHERAATAAVPGTTRDLLGARLALGPVGVVLFDAPGLGATGSVGDRAALDTAARLRAQAELCAVVVDGTDADPPPAPSGSPCMLVVTKADLARRVDVDAWRAAHRPIAVVAVCALRGDGLESLRNAWREWASATAAEDPAGAVGSVRASVVAADRALVAAADAAGEGLGAEIAVVHLREAVDALAGLTGAIDDEAILDVVFARFCIGK